jgi:putative aminopeptidase FrvX
MLDTVKTLCYLSGVSGFEDEVREYILERIMPCADEICTDAVGNLMVFKKGRGSAGKKIMLCAHMDEVGLIITGIEDDGYLRFDSVGSVDRRVLIGKKVYIGTDRVPGVIGHKAVHLIAREDEKTVVKLDGMYIDIGAQTGEEAEAEVPPGSFAVFEDSVAEFGNGYLMGKALDDRVGCAALIKLIEEEPPCDCWFAFTVQEEVGTRGAKVASSRLEPDIAIVIEGTTAADLPGVDGDKIVCELGKGPVVPFMDKGTVYDRGLYEAIRALAEKNGIKTQTKRMIAGGTDAAAIQRSGGGIRTAAISAAIRNIHTPACVAKISDFEDILKLARLFLEDIARS